MLTCARRSEALDSFLLCGNVLAVKISKDGTHHKCVYALIYSYAYTHLHWSFVGINRHVSSKKNRTFYVIVPLALGSTQPVIETSTRDLLWGVKAAGA